MTKIEQQGDIVQLTDIPAAWVEPFDRHCRFECEIGRQNEGCNKLDCLKFWAEYSPNDFMEAVWSVRNKSVLSMTLNCLTICIQIGDVVNESTTKTNYQEL